MTDWFEKRTLGALLDNVAQRFGSREGLCYEGQRCTFGQLQEQTNRTARALIHLGVQTGDKE